MQAIHGERERDRSAWGNITVKYFLNKICSCVQHNVTFTSWYSGEKKKIVTNFLKLFSKYFKLESSNERKFPPPHLISSRVRKVLGNMYHCYTRWHSYTSMLRLLICLWAFKYWIIKICIAIFWHLNVYIKLIALLVLNCLDKNHSWLKNYSTPDLLCFTLIWI